MPPLNPPATLRVKSNPTPLLERTGSVYIYHPGYDPPKLLLDLTVYPPSPDHDSEAASSGGIPLTLVCYACEIVANNVAGRLTEFEDENTIIVDMEVQDTLLHGNALLPPGEYKYHATSDDEKYATRIFILISAISINADWSQARRTPRMRSKLSRTCISCAGRLGSLARCRPSRW